MFNQREGTLRFESHEALCAEFGLVPGTPVVLTGIDQGPVAKPPQRCRATSMFDLFGDPQRPLADAITKAYEHQDKRGNRLISVTASW
jgi:hypothetical protein